MSLWWNTIKAAYENANETGKYLTLFFLVMLLIVLINNRTSSRKAVLYPSLLLCLIVIVRGGDSLYWLPIFPILAYGGTLAAGYSDCIEINVKQGWKLFITVLLLCIAIMFSGSFFMNREYVVEAADTIKMPKQYMEVFDALLADSDSPKVIFHPEMAVYARMYSSKLRTLYSYPEDGNEASLGIEVGEVYKQFSGNHSKTEEITEIARKHACDYIVYNADKHFPDLPYSFFEYELLTSVGPFQIYRDTR